MKQLLIVALVLVAIAACSKKSDTVTPDAASSVAGTYNLSYIRSDSAAVPIFGPYNLPIISNGSTVGSGTLTVTRITADSVSINGRLISPNIKDVPLTFGNFGLKASGASYIMTAAARNGFINQVSTIDGKTLSIDVSYIDPYNTKVNDRDVVIGSR